MRPKWWSQEFAPEGSAAAEGIVKQLGQPALDPLTVLVREAAQNSLDASRDDADTVEFSVTIRSLGMAAETWRRHLGVGSDDVSGLDISGHLASDSVIMIISDRNTCGLGGPLRANLSASAERRSDFVQFLRNVGEGRDLEHAGGTYGFGKGILYRLSSCRAILVDTLAEGGRAEDRRMMGAALGESWVRDGKRYIGRHWWGEIAEDGIPDPLLGVAAQVLAHELGLPGFADGRTGTDIVILGAHLGLLPGDDQPRGRTVQEAATHIRSAILWNLWPKFIPDNHGRRMRFFVGAEGPAEEIPSPETFEVFQPFVESLREIRADHGIPYRRVTPPKIGGSFALSLGAVSRTPERLMVSTARPFEGPPHHVARMRTVELVVDYVEGPPHPNQQFAYGAVFKASEEADFAFAAAEPPTHDAWVLAGLSGPVRGVVQGAKSFITRQVDLRLGIGSQAGGSGQGLGRLASRLSSLIPPLDSTSKMNASGPSVHGGSPGTRRGDTRESGKSAFGSSAGEPRVVGQPSLHVYDGVPLVVAKVLVPAAQSTRVLSAEVFVVLEGGSREVEPPAGAVLPSVQQWRPVRGDGPAFYGSSLVLGPGAESEWWVYATHTPDAVVRFRITQEAGL